MKADSRSANLMTNLNDEHNACPDCQRKNLEGRRFCSRCGLELADQCPSCRHDLFISDPFCGECGTNLVKHYQEIETTISSRLEEMKIAASEHNYDKALSLAASTLRQKHPRLRKMIAKVDQTSQEIKSHRDKTLVKVQALLESAKTYLRSRQQQGAIEELEKIPSNVMPDEGRDFLNELRNRAATYSRLKDSIDVSVTAGKLDGLLPQISQLLDNQPTETKYKQLGVKVAAELLKMVNSRLIDCKYASAIRLANQFVAPFNSSVLKTAKNSALTGLSLEIALVTMDRVDRQFGLLVRRMEREFPKHPGLTKWKDEVAKAKTEAGKEPRIEEQRRRKDSIVGVGQKQPWLWHSSGLMSVPENSATRGKIATDRNLPITHSVAALGLALQGLQEVPIEQNFAEAKKGMFSFSFGGKKKSKTAWGVQIENKGLHAVRLIHDESSAGGYTVDHVGDYPFDLLIEDSPSFRQSLQVAVSKWAISLAEKPGSIIVGLPPQNLLPRFFTVPSADEKKLEPLVKMEMERHCPFKADTVVSRWKCFNDLNLQGLQPVLGTMVKKTDLSEITSIFASLKIEISAIQSAPQGLFNWCYEEWLSKESPLTKDQSGIGVLDIGRYGTTYLAAWNKRFWWRYFPLGSQQLISNMAKGLGLTLQAAEEALAKPAAIKRFDRFWEILHQYQEQMTAEVQRSIEQSEFFMAGIGIKNMVCCGVGSEILGTIESLRYGSETLALSEQGIPSTASANADAETVS